MKIKTEKSIIYDNYPKVVVPKNFDIEYVKKLKEYFTVIFFVAKDKEMCFYSDNADDLEIETNKSIPSNVVALIECSNEVKKLYKHTINIKLKDSWSPDFLVITLLKMHNQSLQQELIALQKDNFETRRILENRNNTLKNLSNFINATQLPLSKIEFSFPKQNESNTLTLKKGNIYRQYIPVSSYYLSGIKLYFNLAKNRKYHIDDNLMVKVVGSSSNTTIACWNVPISQIKESVLFELRTPYIESRESIVIYLELNADLELPIYLSKKAFYSSLYLLDDAKQQVLSKAPLALEIYKNYETFAMVDSPFIMEKDKRILEFKNYYLSKEAIENSLTVVKHPISHIDNDKSKVLVLDGSIYVKTYSNIQIHIKRPISNNVKSVTVRAKVKLGQGKIGITLVQERYLSTFLDDVLLENEKSFFFSGWYNGDEAEYITLSLVIEDQIGMQKYLVLMVDSGKKLSYELEWYSIEFCNTTIDK